MNTLDIPEITVMPPKHWEEIEAIVIGYPLEYFDMKDGGHMVNNDDIIPFYCEGKMNIKVCN